MRKLFATMSITWAALGSAVLAQEPDVFNGETLYKKCAACHRIGEGATHKVGPHLNEIIGKPVAHYDDYRYSKAFKKFGETGAVWDEALLNAFLEAPKDVVPKTKMSFRGMSDGQDRADLIAFLASYNAEDAEIHGFEVSAEILAIEGDYGYGEYLSSECLTCHSASGADSGIPAIINWAQADFVTAMHAYKEKFRDNPVMQQIAGRLNDEEIASLALYFEDFQH